MLSSEEVESAVELQRKTYGLLQWVGEAVAKGTLTFGRAHEYATMSESMRDWLVTYTRQIPGRWRPRMSDPNEVIRFANLFTSYLFTSFELLEDPVARTTASTGDCCCELCRYLVAATHLKRRRISDHEKRRARVLKQEYMQALAVEHRQNLPTASAQSLIDGEQTAEVVALATYGLSLVRRCKGDPGEPAILSLWREFAWTPTGSPRQGFTLTADMILDGERTVLERLAV